MNEKINIKYTLVVCEWCGYTFASLGGCCPNCGKKSI